MKILISIMISVLAVTGIIDDIATVNRLKKEAEQAYKEKDYPTAINRYNILLDSLNVEDENIRMNLAHAYLRAGDTAAAQQNYSRMISSDNRQVKSLAYQQLGVINSGKKQYKEALGLFKESLKADPSNEESRYNYELVKKLLEEQQQQNEQQQDQEQQNQDQNQQNQDQQSEDQEQQQQDQEGEQSEQGEQEQKSEQQGEEGEQQPEQPEEQNAQQGQEQQEGEQSEDEQSSSSVSEKLKEMNISEEKAQMILDAMRNSEMQYIQQKRRKPKQARDRNKPDW